MGKAVERVTAETPGMEEILLRISSKVRTTDSSSLT